MVLVDYHQVLNNLIVIGILLWFVLMLWSKINPLTREKFKESISGLFKKKEDFENAGRFR